MVIDTTNTITTAARIAYRVAGVARYATTEDGERNALSLVPHSETPALGNQCFRACPMPNRAHNRPRPALSHVPEVPPAAARYMIWRGLSLERLPRGVQSVRFRPPLRIWGIGARPGGCFFSEFFWAMCPVCVHFVSTFRQRVTTWWCVRYKILCPCVHFFQWVWAYCNAGEKVCFHDTHPP